MYLLNSYQIESKLVRDPIYGFIELPKELLPVIDHRLFQRLRWVGQLPLEQLVYPSAQHSRFEHSLGVLHLAMVSAISLISNSRSLLEELYNQDPDFSKIIDKNERNKNFILLCGLSGLLHDLGHAPFSHTLEDACKYSKIKYKYDHEEVGYYLAKYILDKTVPPDKIYVLKTLKVLNKKLKTVSSHLQPIENIVRTMIDGPFDVDKADYIYRDSYHCGANYGFYDIQRLWRNVVINKSNSTIGINSKGALETWTLRFQRYKMYQNVYKHHTRNITDAMLIDILSKSFDILIDQPQEEWNRELIPIKESVRELETHDVIDKFIYWSDNSILKEISNMGSALKSRIEQFLERKIYKRDSNKQDIVYDLSKYPEVFFEIAGIKSEYPFHIALKKLKEDIQTELALNFDVLIDTIYLPPVFEKAVQNDIQIIENDIPISSLAKFLGFDVKTHLNLPDDANQGEGDSPSKNYNLYIYVDPQNIASIPTIKEEIEKLLSNYKPHATKK